MPLRSFADMYCWCCHLEDAMYSCKKCPRTYHRRCVFEMPNYPEPVFDPESMDPSSMDACPECVVASETVLNNMKKVEPSALKSILRHVINNLRGDEYWFKNFYEIPQPKSNTRSRAVVVRFMDVSTLERNVEREMYKTLEGFFGDVKWIRHNIAVTAGRRSDEMTTAEKLLHFVALEMLEIDLCYECYVRKQGQDKLETWFVQACSRPHLLAWAKQDGLSYWPVKVMGIDAAKRLAIVHFFGEHAQAEVSLKHCLIYTPDPPQSTKKLKGHGHIHGWRGACKEIRKHLDHLEERHGKVVLAEEKKRITSTLTEAVQRMFPDWKLKTVNSSVDDEADDNMLDERNDENEDFDD